MNQFDYARWSIILGVASLVISFGVGIVVFWYTRETQKLRKAAQHQLELSREQIRATITPFLDLRPGEVRQGQDVPHTQVAEVRPRMPVDLINVTDRLAYDVAVVLQSPVGLYCGYVDYVEAHAGRSEDVFTVGLDALRDEEAFTHLAEHYGPECLRDLREREDMFGAVIFRDLRGNVCIIERSLAFTDGGQQFQEGRGLAKLRWF